MAAQNHLHDFAQTAGGHVCSTCGTRLTDAQILTNKPPAGQFGDWSAIVHYIFKKING